MTRSALGKAARLAFAAAIGCAIALTGGAPAAADSHQPLVSVNQRLAGIARDPSTSSMPATAAQNPQSRNAAGAPQLASVIAAARQRVSAWPLRIPAAMLRLTKVERALHVRTNVIDANFWGLFESGRGASLRISIHF